MVMLNSKQSTFTSPRHQVYARLFGRCIEKIRESSGHSVEEDARLAGMESSEWAAIEAGHVPAIRPNCVRWPALLNAITTRSFGWPSSAREPGACKLSCRRPRTSGGTGGGYS